jgi:DNA-directed RNA polymerase subunit N (RpoN/RPB10)
MLIPIKCFTCNKTIADVYDYYIKETEKLQKKMDDKDAKGAPVTKKKAAEEHEMRHFDRVRTGKILDDLGLTRYCCRRHMLGTVDMMETI